TDPTSTPPTMPADGLIPLPTSDPADHNRTSTTAPADGNSECLHWIVDLDEPVSLLDCHLAEDFGYADSGAITGTFTLSAPFSVQLALDLLI
ncbi:MAG: hypothetical protein ACRDQ4_09315, partial [Pseudonocardiaceae bacterium]